MIHATTSKAPPSCTHVRVRVRVRVRVLTSLPLPSQVERLMEYSKLDREAGTDDVAGAPRQDRLLEGWPSHGGIKFSRFSMAYRVGLPNVLADVSLKIRPEERVGICGRTGAGKSSFLTALLRLNDYHKGKIWYENAPPPPPLISFFVRARTNQTTLTN